jgi:hypothetical protein
MTYLDYQKLKKDLIAVLQRYIVNAEDEKNKQRARLIWSKFIDAMPVLDETMQYAVIIMEWIGWDVGVPPPPTKHEIEELIRKLKQ